MIKYPSAFDALSGDKVESANLKMRAELMRHITTQIKQMNATQAMIAKQCGISQPRLNDLLNGRMSKFSLDALVNINASLGQEVGLVFA